MPVGSGWVEPVPARIADEVFIRERCRCADCERRRGRAPMRKLKAGENALQAARAVDREHVPSWREKIGRPLCLRNFAPITEECGTSEDSEFGNALRTKRGGVLQQPRLPNRCPTRKVFSRPSWSAIARRRRQVPSKRRGHARGLAAEVVTALMAGQWMKRDRSSGGQRLDWRCQPYQNSGKKPGEHPYRAVSGRPQWLQGYRSAWKNSVSKGGCSSASV